MVVTGTNPPGLKQNERIHMHLAHKMVAAMIIIINLRMKLKRRESPSLRVRKLTDILNKIKFRSTKVGGRGKILTGV